MSFAPFENAAAELRRAMVPLPREGKRRNGKSVRFFDKYSPRVTAGL